jgi:hypothetical protein
MIGLIFIDSQKEGIFFKISNDYVGNLKKKLKSEKTDIC